MRRRSLLACALLAVTACARSPDRRAEPPLATPSEPDVAAAVEDVLGQVPEALSAEPRKCGVDPKALVGTWDIVHTVSTTGGVASAPTEPIMPGSWVFDATGAYHKRRGNELDGTYLLTEHMLLVSTLGPVLEYRIDELTPTQLVVTLAVMEGMSSTTTLRRAK